MKYEITNHKETKIILKIHMADIFFKTARTTAIISKTSNVNHIIWKRITLFKKVNLTSIFNILNTLKKVIKKVVKNFFITPLI